eukprot:scaffold317_cov260-Pinguiococcus_pyrenoidosus.AAC.50
MRFLLSHYYLGEGDRVEVTEALQISHPAVAHFPNDLSAALVLGVAANQERAVDGWRNLCGALIRVLLKLLSQERQLELFVSGRLRCCWSLPSECPGNVLHSAGVVHGRPVALVDREASLALQQDS